MDNKELQQYRTKLYRDTYSNIIPDRIPIQDGFAMEFMLQYANKDLMTIQYQYSEDLLVEVYEKVINEVACGDKLPGSQPRNAIQIMLEQSRLMKMGSNGFIQHPETSMMNADEYDDFIKNPFDFLIEVVSPRCHAQYEKGSAFRSRAFLLSYLAEKEQGSIMGAAGRKMIEKYGFFAEPAGSGVGTQPPFDMLTDYCRGFSQIPKDMRRCPEKVHAAMDALMPYILEIKPAKPDILGSASVMTHMAAFLNTKQFEEFYFPQFKELTHINAERGIYMTHFLEQDWDRFVDHLTEMPMGTRFYVEQGNMKLFKDKMGKKFVLGGFYPLELFRGDSKEKCIDKAKEVLDILAVNGNYFFRFDKQALSIDDINVENYKATMKYLLENSHFSNAGEKVETSIKREDTILTGLADKYPKFSSKYALSFDEYKKEYPPVSPEAEPFMRAAYDKYMRYVLLNRNC